MQARFFLTTKIDLDALQDFSGPLEGESEFDVFLSAMLLMSGDANTLINKRRATYFWNYIHFGALTKGLKFEKVGPVMVLSLKNEVRFWHGSVLDWKHEIIDNLNIPGDLNVFYSGALHKLRGYFPHLFYTHDIKTNPDRTYRIVQR